jgi:T5SS/PEP-CTERM-associated repeat protein
VTINNELYVAGTDVEHTSGYALNASGGTGWLKAGNEYVGYQGRDFEDTSQPAGQFIQGGGTNLANNLYVGFLLAGDLTGLPSTGLYTLTAGTLLVSASQIVGDRGSGTFNQSGGYNECASLSIGHQAGSSGAYTLSGPSQLVSDSLMYVGYNGSGAFTQNGGETDVASTLYVAYNPNSAGQYNLNSGTLVNHGLILGDDTGTSATFSQTGGYNYVVNPIGMAGTLSLADFSSNSAGTYNLSGGTLLLGQTTYVGKVGAGTFHQSGGWHETITMFVGAGAAATGTYLLDNGTLLVHVNETIGQFGNGTFIQTGGTHTVNNTLYLPQPGASGFYGLYGGQLSASTILLTAGGTLDEGAGESGSTTKLFQMGGTISGTLQNNGTFNYASGTFSGQLVNHGVINLLSDFSPGNGIDNEASFTLGGGRHVTLNGQGMFNAGTFTLAADGSIAGPADFHNVGTFNYNGGTFDGHLTQIGTFNYGSSFTAGNGMTVDVPMSVGAGQIMTLKGQGLDGPGTFTVLAGGTLNTTSESVWKFSQTGGVTTASTTTVSDNDFSGHTLSLGGGTFSSTGVYLGSYVDNPFPSQGLISQTAGVMNPTYLTIDMIPPDIFAEHNSQFDQNVRYSLFGGTLTANEERVNAGGQTQLSEILGFVQNGGLNSTGSLTVGDYTGALGWYRLSAGTLAAGTESIGGAGTGLFGQIGGAHVVSGTLSIGSSQAGNGEYDFYGSSLSAGTIQVNATGAFNCFANGTILGNLVVNKDGILGIFHDIQMGANIILQAGAITHINNNLIATAAVTLNGATVDGSGTLSLAPTATMRGSGTVEISALNNAGTVEADINPLVITSPTLINTGTMKNLPGASLFVKSGSFNNNGMVVVNGGGVVSFDPPMVNSGGSTISLLGGVLAAPLVTNSTGGVVTGFGQITGNFTNSGNTSFVGPTQIVGDFTNNASATVAVRNAQTLITGLSTNLGTITTSNGTIIFDGGIAPAPPAGGGIDGPGAMVLSPGAHLISSYVRQSTLSITGAPGATAFANIRDKSDGGSFSDLNSLTIGGGTGSFTGMLDLADNDAIIAATPVATIAAYISSGFNGGNWQGTGINSSLAAFVAGDLSDLHKTALGYATALALGVTVFDGQSVGGSNVLVRYTWSGDANLDGKVNALDFNAVATNFGSGSNDFWSQGDFNYDGTVNTLDFTQLAINFNQPALSPALGSVVPEPMCMWLTLASAFPRRRRFETLRVAQIRP